MRRSPPLLLAGLLGCCPTPPATTAASPTNQDAVTTESPAPSVVTIPIPAPDPDAVAPPFPSPPSGSSSAADTGEGRPDGATCATGDDCASGLCEGEGCGDDAGTCVARDRMCTRDLFPFCGCDGETFRGSSRCPGRRFEHRGECGRPAP